MSRYFPIFINMEGKCVTVVGAGRIATRRIGVLLDFGAEVTVIAPEISDEIRSMADRLRLVEESYRPGLIAGSAIVLAATDDHEVNLAVKRECEELRIPVNLSDDKDECDFYFPGIASAGDIVVGVTAQGKDHALARRVTERIRDLLEENLS